MSPLTESTRLTLAKVSQPLDADAQAYVNAVEIADGQRIEDPVRFAINNFVIGCKADGIWTAIKASCILAGARTRLGALTPLVGTAPTSFNFADGDYNRKTGLVGDGSTKNLNSNRNNNTDPQNSKHLATYITVANTTSSGLPNLLGYQIDSGSFTGSQLFINQSIPAIVGRINGTTANTINGTVLGFAGASRNLSTQENVRALGTTLTTSSNSLSVVSGNIRVFAGGFGGAVMNYTNARLAFYSIGESLDLALLDTRVSALITAFGVAIP
jgi:hypothetical protein